MSNSSSDKEEAKKTSYYTTASEDTSEKKDDNHSHCHSDDPSKTIEMSTGKESKSVPNTYIDRMEEEEFSDGCETTEDLAELHKFREYARNINELGAAEKKKCGPFPFRFHAILTEIESKKKYDHIISWSPHGRSFAILKQVLFKKEIVPRYFKHSKAPSFYRQLNIYGFRKMSGGRDNGCYYHEYFLRGKPFLSRRITRFNHKKETSKTPSSVPFDHQLDFYSMPPVGTSSENLFINTSKNSSYLPSLIINPPLVPAATINPGECGHDQNSSDDDNNNNNNNNPVSRKRRALRRRDNDISFSSSCYSQARDSSSTVIVPPERSHLHHDHQVIANAGGSSTTTATTTTSSSSSTRNEDHSFVHLHAYSRLMRESSSLQGTGEKKKPIQWQEQEDDGRLSLPSKIFPLLGVDPRGTKEGTRRVKQRTDNAFPAAAVQKSSIGQTEYQQFYQDSELDLYLLALCMNPMKLSSSGHQRQQKEGQKQHEPPGFGPGFGPF